jgi:hypothetical protein
MGKRGKKQKIDNRFPKRTTRDDDDASFDMDDEIDACKLIHSFFLNYFCNNFLIVLIQISYTKT